MTWTIEFVPDAAKDLRRLGRAEAKRILDTLASRIAPLDDPRSLGAPLVGSLSGLWRWRVGDYRAIARIEDARPLILVVRVAHRRDAHR